MIFFKLNSKTLIIDYMKSILQMVLLMNRTVPEGFDSVKDIRSHIRETRSGIILGNVSLDG